MRSTEPDLRDDALMVSNHTVSAIDIATEELIPVRDVPSRLPAKNGKRVHFSAVYRWMKRGVGGVRLEYVSIGGTRYTSVEALQRFADRRGAAQNIGYGEPPLTPARRRRQMIAAAREAKRILDRERRQ